MAIIFEFNILIPRIMIKSGPYLFADVHVISLKNDTLPFQMAGMLIRAIHETRQISTQRL